uniref:Trichome birefringence-like C-terminal domain-containing protein n=1 Tax=Odontella aurita TaxID=265563 RepID=A0A7S4HSR3_9STRA
MNTSLVLLFALGGTAVLILNAFRDGVSLSQRSLPALYAAGGDESGTCASRRGASGGHWEKDVVFAQDQQYHPMVPNRMGKRSNDAHKPDPSDPENTKYRAPTTYFWRDSPETEEECGRLIPLHRAEFCRVAERLELDRILFVGDSLTYGMSYALRAQVGIKAKIPNKILVDGVEILQDDHWNVTHVCRSGRKVIIEEHRSDHLNDELGFPAEKRRLPVLRHWIDNYLDFSGKTLLVVNTGAHFPARPQLDYRSVMDWFFDDLLSEKFDRPDDIVIMRTTPPGHPDCTTAVRPHASEEEFLASFRPENIPIKKNRLRTSQYRWDTFDDMDAYMKEKVAQHKSRREIHLGPGPGPAVHLLDVVPLTRLRPDGHVSGPDNLDPLGKPEFDCLHYALPGPIDWWNNLMFANLADLPPANAAPATSADGLPAAPPQT